MLGMIEPSELEQLRDEDGITIAEAMRSVGLEPERYRDAIRTDLDAFVELHIEQGRILYDEGLPLGVVSTITGLYRFLVTVDGRTDHAGTTPMDLRQDAFQAAAEMSLAITRLAEAEGRPAVLTTGWWDIQPGAWNIVPGRVQFGVDLRHPDETTKQRLAAEAHAMCQGIADRRGVKVSHEVVGDILPRDMHPAVRARDRSRRRRLWRHRTFRWSAAPATTVRSWPRECRRPCSSSPATTAAPTAPPNSPPLKTPPAAPPSWPPRSTASRTEQC